MKYNHSKLKLRAIVAVFAMFVLGLNANAQQLSVSGIVKDAANGDPILGASIIEKGTSKGIITDVNGKFTISVATNATLVVKYLGYLSVEVPISGRTNIVVQLKENSIALGEVVAIGYGVVRKNDATGSITAIKPDKLNRGLTTNAQDMITGKIAGVVVTSGGGTPGGGATIRIRGGSSLSASNDPLIVIDGLAMDNDGIKGVANPLSTINPNDIETFTVLKDASATAIYGSRASNGVIIITTKKGEKGSKLKVSYDGNMSISTIRNQIKVLTGDQFRAMVNDTTLYKFKSDILAKLGTANTDWQNQIYQSANSTDHNINLTGAFKNTPYRFSFGYTNQDGIIKTSNFERYTGALSLSPSFFDDHLKININAKGMLAKNRYADGGVVGAAMSMDPTQPVTSDLPAFKPFGGYWEWLKSDGSANNLATRNPVATLNQKSDVAHSSDFIGSAEIDYKFHFLPELRAHLNLGIEASQGKQDLYIPLQAAGNSPYGREGWDQQSKTNKSLNFYLQYAKEIEKNKFDIMGGYEWQHFYREGSSEYQGLIKNVYNKDLNDSVGNSYIKSIFKTESYLVSFFGRLNYSYDGKYLATVTLRDDGTSRFAPENRWGLFPAAALAWKINEEDFMKDKKIFSDLKLRLGYGITGQQNINQGDYPYIPVYTTSQVGAYYQFDSTFVVTSRPDAYNTKLKWEQTTTWNAGLDFGILNNRITSSLDYYYRVTNDLINVVSVPSGTNFRSKVISNIGSLYNRGFEFTINAKPIQTKDLTWDISYNLTYNQNQITKLTTGNVPGYIVETGGTFQGSAQAHAVGQPANSFYVYKQKYDANGKPIEIGAYKDPNNISLGKYKDIDAFVDMNNDSIINTKDKYFNHNQNADFTMGLSSKVIYKNFDFGFTLRASIGNYVYNAVAAGNLNVGESGIWNSLLFYQNKPVSAFDANFKGTSTLTFLSDYFVQDASFVKCDNITLGYSFKNLFNVISSGRIYATVQNPFVLTPYKGLDPEIYGGIDNNIYPRAMVTLVGISLNF
jgi:TonB-dependent starch-binding outer membrane protein SusC